MIIKCYWYYEIKFCTSLCDKNTSSNKSSNATKPATNTNSSKNNNTSSSKPQTEAPKQESRPQPETGGRENITPPAGGEGTPAGGVIS